jgi:hypothetical protein
MKSGRRNTIEKLEPLTQSAEGAGALVTGAAGFAAGRYHTLPHHSRYQSKRNRDLHFFSSNPFLPEWSNEIGV